MVEQQGLDLFKHLKNLKKTPTKQIKNNGEIHEIMFLDFEQEAQCSDRRETRSESYNCLGLWSGEFTVQ
jgi:hypothetical protein